MISDFTKLESLIPQGGRINITVQRARDAKKLTVLFQSKHPVKKPSQSHSTDKGIKEGIEAVESASKQLNKVVAFTELPDILTVQFEEAITKQVTVEMSIRSAIDTRVDELNAALEALKAKTAAKKPGSTAGKTTQPVKIAEKTAEPGDLFGTATAQESASCHTEPEAGEDDEEPGDETYGAERKEAA